jgi:hypothetical protein
VRTPYNLILINLAAVEFLIAIVGAPLDVLALLKEEWVLGKGICVLSGSVVTTCGMTHTI